MFGNPIINPQFKFCSGNKLVVLLAVIDFNFVGVDVQIEEQTCVIHMVIN